MKMLQQLTFNAVNIVRRCFLLLPSSRNENWKEYEKHRRLSHLYFTHTARFTNMSTNPLHNSFRNRCSTWQDIFSTEVRLSLTVCRWYLCCTSSDGVRALVTFSNTHTYNIHTYNSNIEHRYTLATHSKSLKAYKSHDTHSENFNSSSYHEHGKIK